MKSTPKAKKPTKKIKHNPVAKHAPKFNKASVHKDQTKYQRKSKHKSTWEKP